jgi:predicted  nucleic acid-binding Zn-ribbon protein
LLDSQQIQTNELLAKLKELLKEYNQQLLAQRQLSNQQTASTAAAGSVDEKVPNYYAQLNEFVIQIRQISMQLKHRLKDFYYNNGANSVYNGSCLQPNSIFDLL